MTTTGLQDELAAAGAVHAGERLIHFGDADAEYRRACEDAVVIPATDRTLIEVTGGDRARFIHNFCTNDVNVLEDGQGCEAFFTNVKARVLGHGFVFNARGSLWIETVTAGAAALHTHLDKYIITDDVEVHDQTNELVEFLVTGPTATQKVGSALEIAADELQPRTASPAAAVSNCVSWRTDLCGPPTMMISVSAADATEVWKRLRAADIGPAGADAFETLRIGAGSPLYGADVTEDHLAPEVARNDIAISYRKGCYLGQEPIARLDALGHVNRQLTRVILSESADAGASVLDGDKAAGTLTSVAPIRSDDGFAALAWLRTEALGAELALSDESGGLRVAVQRASQS